MNLYPLFKSLYPENSIGGQCFFFMHKLVKEDSLFPGMPMFLVSKIKVLNQSGIPISKLDTIKVGDVLLLNYKPFGHGCIVNYINGNNLQVSESNFNYDLRVHHTRQISVHSPDILGVFRGNPAYTIPAPAFPIQLPIIILQNNQPFWNSLLQHMANLQNWFWQASGQRIELILDYKQTTLSGWNTVFTGPVIGGLNEEIIDRKWLDANLPPFKGITIFNMPRSAWSGTVLDHPELIELGYAYEDGKLPGMIMTVSDEHDDYPPYYPTLGAYAKSAGHEIIHLLYGLCANSNVVPGGDYCHNHFYGQNGYPMKPEDCFNDFDYAKLANQLT